MKVNNCCCCSLTTGGYIIGGLGIIGGIISIIYDSYVLASIREFVENNSQFPPETKESIIYYATIYAASRLTAAVINFLTSIALIFGIYKEKHLLLLPWLITGALSIIVLCLILVIYFGLSLFAGSFLGAFLLLVIIGPMIVLCVYLWLVIQALYKAFREHRPV